MPDEEEICLVLVGRLPVQETGLLACLLAEMMLVCTSSFFGFYQNDTNRTIPRYMRRRSGLV